MIREITLEDAQAIYKINKEGLDGTDDLKAVENTLEHLLSLPDQHYLLGYELDGKLVGYVHAQHYKMLYNPNTLLNVVSLSIDNDYRGRGIGSILLGEIEILARESNLDGMRINSGYNRQKAHNFYEKHGYESKYDQKRFIKFFDEIA